MFGDQFRYEDRSALDSKASAHWKNSLLQYRKEVENEIRQDIESRKQIIAGQLDAFDRYSKPKPKVAEKPKKEMSQSEKIKTLDELQPLLDQEGPLTESQKVRAAILLEGLGMALEEKVTQQPEKRSAFGFDFLVPDIKGKSERRLVKKVPEGAGDNQDAQIAQFLKENGRRSTPEDVETFKKNNGL